MRIRDDPIPKMSQRFAIVIGVLYGVICQLAIRAEVMQDLYGVMSLGYIFVLPLILGTVTLWYATPGQQESWLYRLFAPWGTAALCLLVSILVGWEGAICLIMAAVIYLPLASLGGIVTGILLSHRERTKIHSSVFASVLALPLVCAFVEQQFSLPVSYRGAATAIDIDAPVSLVWQNIIRVPPIHEPLDGFFYRMGFPKPVEATLSYEGVGGVRHATFERGLVFIETVDQWIPEELLSFGIRVAPDSVPPTTLDEHVVVGGRYFDVLRGTYRIERLSDQRVRLHLTSDFRLATRFNFYSGVWATFLMRDIQQTILQVIKSRCERQASTSASLDRENGENTTLLNTFVQLPAPNSQFLSWSSPQTTAAQSVR